MSAMGRKAELIGALLLGISTGVAGADFPQRTTGFASPDRKWRVESIPPESAEQDHRLLLVSTRKTHAADTLLIEYPRNVSVSWSPDSRYLAITNNFASNESTCLVVPIPTGKIVDLSRVAKSGNHLAAVAHDDHTYLRCGRWRSNGVLDVTLDSYGDSNPGGINRRGTFDLIHGKITIN